MRWTLRQELKERNCRRYTGSDIRQHLVGAQGGDHALPASSPSCWPRGSERQTLTSQQPVGASGRNLRVPVETYASDEMTKYLVK